MRSNRSKCDVKGKRIGWIGELGNLPMEAGVRELCRDALRTLESMGCIVEEVTPDFDPEAVWKAWLVLRAWMAGGSCARSTTIPKHAS